MTIYKNLMAEATAKPNASTIMYEINEIINGHLAKLKIEHPTHYWEVVHPMHVIINGPHFNEEMAKYAVSCLKNSDGTMGEHWAPVDTKTVATTNGIMFDNFNEWDWYYVLNMIYSEYYSTIGSNVPVYISLAKDWLTNKNAPVGKAFDYWGVIIDGD